MNFTKHDMERFRTFDGSLNEYCIDYKKQPLSVLETIVNVVTSHLNSPEDVLTKKTRKSEYVLPKQLSHYFAYFHTTYSLPVIGEEIGKVDHSSVLHSKKTIQNSIDTDAVTRALVYEIESRLYDVGVRRRWASDRSNESFIEYGDSKRPVSPCTPNQKVFEFKRLDLSPKRMQTPSMKRKRPAEVVIIPERKLIPTIESRVDELIGRLNDDLSIEEKIDIQKHVSYLQIKLNAIQDRERMRNEAKPSVSCKKIKD